MVLNYKIAFSDRALQDINDICDYITDMFHNPDAANNHRADFIRIAYSLQRIPQRNTLLYIGKRQSKHRRQRVKNYYLYYIILEKEKEIEITTVQSCRRDIKNVGIN